MAERYFVEMFGREPGIILTDINPLYLNALLPDPFNAAHPDGERYVKFRNVVTYDRAQALALVKRALDQSRTVYALFVSQKEMDEKALRLPQIDGYEWAVAENLPAKAVIWKLSRKLSNEKGFSRFRPILAHGHIDLSPEERTYG